MSRVISILIADDEHLVHRGIRHLLSGHEEFRIAAEAMNGREAVEMAGSLAPDIVLMDVRMPVMDGLAALAEIKRARPGTRTVILSGHSDFHYAQQALKLGASDYLLKPTDLPGLINVLHNLRQEILREEESRKEEQKLLPAYTEQVFRQLLQNELLPEEVEERLELLAVDGTSVCAVLCGYDDDYRLRSTRSAGEYLDLGQNLAACARETLRRRGKEKDPVLDLGVVGIIYFCDRVEEAAAFAADLGTAVKKATGCTVTSAVGSCQPLAKAPVSYREAQEHLRQRLVLGGDAVITAAPAGAQSGGRYPVALERELVKAIRFGDQKAAGRHLDALFGALDPVGLSASGWRQICFDLFRQAAEIALELNIVLDEDLLPYEKSKEIARLTSLRDLRLWLDHNLAVLMGKIRASNAGPSLPVKKALAYIDQHFRADLSLAALAAHVSLSPNYLCQLFKQETGRSFLDHLTARRLEEAKKLLRQGEKTVSEVAFQVGYDNVRYFCEVFRKHENVTPGQYRRGERDI